MKNIYFQRMCGGFEIGFFGWILWFRNWIILIIPFILFSCGSIEKLKESKEVKTDSLSETNSSSRLNRWINSDKYTLEPADLSQPMRFVNSKGEVNEYFNTKVIHEKEIIHETKKDTLANKTELEKEIDDEKKFKETDNTTLILGIVGIVFGFLFMIIIFVVWYFGKKMNAMMQLLPKVS